MTLSRKGIVVFGLGLGLLVACGGGGDGDKRFGPEGVWRGEASAMRTGRPIVLCLEIENFQATAPPERFSGALYIDGERDNLVSGTWGPGDNLSFSTDERTFTGIVAVERLYGSWRTYGPATGNTGGWTLDRTDDESCGEAGSRSRRGGRHLSAYGGGLPRRAERDPAVLSDDVAT